MASSSWCKETDGKINYTKLCRLLVDGGTQAIRSVFDGIHPPSSLKANLIANKTTLQKLKKPKGKVLNNEQWDKLYPPSGSDPKSEDFDITLLFVLLRNICGLTPPATGWDVLPPGTDNSQEADLARIKYYRNNTIAHKPNTEINDADFKQHWQDISSALLSLGLSQDDIDDLKSAPLGKKDYNQLLYEWYISDKNVKTQLEEVKTNTADLKSDTADLKLDTADLMLDTADLMLDTADLMLDTADLMSDTADLKSDTADLKSDTADLKLDTADLKSDTADLKSDTADLKLDTADLKSDTADLKSDTADLKLDTADLKSDTADLKSDTADLKLDTADLKLDTADLKLDTADLKSDTADLKSDTADLKLDTADLKLDTADLKLDTADLKSNTTDLMSDTADLKSDTAGIKSDTADLKSDTADLKSDTAGIKSDTADLKSDTADLKSDTADLKSDTADIKDKLDVIRNANIARQKRDQAIEKLHYSDFGPEINCKCKSYHANTRRWILDQVKSHVDSDQPDSCIMLITAGPGMGKSTIAAKLCQTYKGLGRLAGCHFFQFSNSTRNNPRLMLQSIARQMCDTVPGYQETLERKLQTDFGKKISEMNCEELLTILLEEPLCNVEQTSANLVVVLDALDECSHDPRDELLRALRNKLSCFPSWLRFIVTSRPSTNASVLGLTFAVEIRAEDPSNVQDLDLFLSSALEDLYPEYDFDENRDLVQKLVQMTNGLFLVAFFVIDLLKRENFASPEKVLKLFPNGMSSVYENYFARLKEDLLPYIAEEETFYKMLEAVVATNNPLPKDMFYNILCLKSERDVPRQERKRRKDALNSLHWLFPVESDHVAPFHKSVFDWLTLEGDEEHNFSVRVEDGNKVIVSQCNEVLIEIRDGKKDLDKPLNLTDSERYSLIFLHHLVKKRSTDVQTFKSLFSNIYILTALTIEDTSFGNLMIEDDVISSSLSDIFRFMQICFRINSPHNLSCRFFRPTSFGSYLAFVLQGVYAEGLSEETTPIPLVALKKHRLPYFYEEDLLQTPLAVIEGHPCLFSSLQYLLKCKEGFLAVLPIALSNSLSTAIYLFQPDGRLVTWKRFPTKRLITTSPNINLIVTAEEKGSKIEILDATTLKVVRQCQSPHDSIETCHVFGDVQGCFIVIKGSHDNKIYVIEGLTGQVRNVIALKEGSTVMDVGRQGHIVVTRTWERYEPEKRNAFTSKDGEVELMNWKIGKSEFASPRKPGIQTPSKEYFMYTYRELILYHYDRGQEPIPIYPLAGEVCSCRYRLRSDINVDDAVHVSEDGRLLAYHYKDSIFIVNTSDGSLFKRWLIDSWVSCLDILFVSGSHLVITNQSFMSMINVQTNEVEHRIYLPYPVLPITNQYLLYPEEDGKSFNLISTHFKPGFYEVSRLVFYNLNLQGLQ